MPFDSDPQNTLTLSSAGHAWAHIPHTFRHSNIVLTDFRQPTNELPAVHLADHRAKLDRGADASVVEQFHRDLGQRFYNNLPFQYHGILYGNL